MLMFDYNIITVDWGKPAGTNFYPATIHRAKVVGMYTADLIDTLVYQGLVTSEAIHLMGHSAGAHAMGIAGAFVNSGKVGRISGRLKYSNFQTRGLHRYPISRIYS